MKYKNGGGFIVCIKKCSRIAGGNSILNNNGLKSPAF